ncbi:hypothetical protein MSP7336_04700 [Mycobacterium shimoidei]|uniref:Uncharacterized protein n=1 Tax=Mycobacterium shimoidei TaxID=29313 RepID=A0A375Z5M9_MYCSH|nr:hypothetical protein MSP7336_04700 [Mycobacterium shimoidei]
MLLDRDDVDATADDEQTTGTRLQLVQALNQEGELGGGLGAVGRTRHPLAMQINDRPVGGVHHGQGGAAGLDEKQRDVVVAEGMTDVLGQGGRGEQRGNQHHTPDVAGVQCVTQRTDFAGLGPGHPRRHQLVAALERAFSGAEDRFDHLLAGTGCGADRETVLLDRGAVGGFALNQRHADRRWCHRNTKYDVHFPSIFCSLGPSGGARRLNAMRPYQFAGAIKFWSHGRRQHDRISPPTVALPAYSASKEKKPGLFDGLTTGSCLSVTPAGVVAPARIQVRILGRRRLVLRHLDRDGHRD